jgi:predicted protein tyrosine phosphatase
MRYADRLLRRGGWDCLVSIAGSDGLHHCQRRAKKTLLLDFDDTTPWRKRRRLMTGEQMVQLVEFANQIGPEERCLVHCRAGRCRSPAAAIVVHCVRFGNITKACSDIAEQVPKASPNGWVLALADAVLGNQGSSITLAYVASYTFPRGLKWHVEQETRK